MSEFIFEIKDALATPSTWWQLSLLAAGILLAGLADQLRRKLLKPSEPGAERNIAGHAMHAGSLVAIPFILWLWLIVVAAVLKNWMGFTGEILDVAITLVGAFVLIRIGVWMLRRNLSPGGRLRAWEGAFTAAIWALVALKILGWLAPIEEALESYALTLGETRISLLAVISFVASLGVLLLLALWIANLLHSRLQKSKLLNTGMKMMLAKSARFALLTLAVLIAMSTAGFDLTALAVFGGALGVGLGLGLQRIVSNIVSGFILIFEESIRPGDVITIGDTFGTVQSLHTRYIVVRDPDGKDILIPNENMLTTEITNWSYHDRNIRVKVPIQISYGDDPQQALDIMCAVARKHPRVIDDPAPKGHLLGFGDSGIDIELHAWIKDPEDGLINIRTDLYLEIWKKFKTDGITVPFPQREVKILATPDSAKPPVPEK